MNTVDKRIKRHGLARVLSKLGLVSRTEGARLIAEGLVTVNAKIIRDPEYPTRMGIDTIRLNKQAVSRAERRVLLLNKPRGLVCTRSDERERATVYDCLPDDIGWLAPVGRLDKASEGALLFSNDPEFAASITDPDSGPDKTYHVQIDCIPEDSVLHAIQIGIVDAGEVLSAKRVCLIRQGGKHAWLEIVLSEGRNRQIRRLLQAFDIGVLRLIRTAIGGLRLGDLPKGQWRYLEPDDITALLDVSE